MTPGVRFLLYGSTEEKDGWWNWDKFEVQLKDLIELFNFLCPQYQLLVEIDWSAGHSKHREGALNAKAMAAGYGGAQPHMRRTLIERVEGFLGPNAVLKVGVWQELVYREGCEPPHFEPNAPMHDVPATENTKAVEGYMNKPKGLKQILWERGL